MKISTKFLFALLVTLVGNISASAYDFEVEGIYYNTLSMQYLTCEVTDNNTQFKSYSGDIVIPSSVTYEGKTFKVTSIGREAFKNCSGLTSINIPNSVTSIGSSAFSGCSGLTSINIPNSITSIGTYAFYGCSALTSINIPNSVTSIDSYAFYNCSGLTSITIPNSVTSIGNSAFSNCTGLISVKYNATDCTYMGNYNYPVFAGCASLNEILIGDNVHSIPSCAFCGRINIVSINIPNSVTSIGSSAFFGCNGLISIIIPNSVTSIGDEAFRGCSSLSSITIGTGVQYVGWSAFANCTSLYKLILLPNTVPSGLNSALLSLNGRITYVANNNYFGEIYGTIKKMDYLSSYFDVDGVRYVPVSPSERTCAAISCTYSDEDKDIKIGSTVTYKGIVMTVVEIGKHLVRNNKNVETIEVTAKVDIPDCFAYGCTNVKSVRLSDDIASIGTSAFHSCSYMNTINIPSGITAIADYTFYGCGLLESIVLPEVLKTIKRNAFEKTGLTSIMIPAATTSIEDGVFNDCKALAKFEAKDGAEALTLGYNNASYSKGLFCDCPLKEVVIGRNLSYKTGSDYGYSPFYRNTYLERVLLTDIPTEVFTNEFYGCTSLKEVSIGDGVTKMGDYAFSGCSAIETFTFGKSVTEIGKEAFSDCTSMTKLNAEPSTPPVCGTQALDDINKWNCTLCVPQNSIANYQTADQWKEFFFMVGDEFEGGDTPETCAAPEIALENGELVITSETPDSKCIYSIRPNDFLDGKTKSGTAVELSGVYTITAYAVAEGMYNSETVTMLLYWSKPSLDGETEMTLVGDLNGDGKVNIADLNLVIDIMSER